MTRAEFDTAVESLTPRLRSILMQLAIDNDNCITVSDYTELERLGLVEGFDFEGFDTVVRGVYRTRKYHMPSDVHIWCCAWMSEAYEAPRKVKR